MVVSVGAGTTDQANHGGQGPAAAVANCIAHRTACDRTHGRAGAGGLALLDDLLGGAHLARHGDLLHHCGAREHAGKEDGGGAGRGGHHEGLLLGRVRWLFACGLLVVRWLSGMMFTFN
jgi:hypothetical protein